ncbi:uncharacterized protein LOC144150020 [Haemaphysalis longicornis]
MIWDRKSIMITVGFFASVIIVAWAACSAFNWVGGSKVIMLTRDEAAKMVRERGCKCRKARSGMLPGTGRPKAENYVCNCPPAGKAKPRKKSAAKTAAKGTKGGAYKAKPATTGDSSTRGKGARVKESL